MRPPTRTFRVDHSTRATVRDLYWEWVRAEVDTPAGSPRYGDRQVHGLDNRMLQLLAKGERGRLTARDWESLRAAYRRLRGDYLDPLLSGGTHWSYRGLRITELYGLRIPNLTISLVPLAPSRRLEEFVAALDAGQETPDLSNHLVYEALRVAWDPARVRGCPILLAEIPEGPYVIAEGLTRLCVLLSRWEHRGRVPTVVRTLVGVSSRVREWRWW